MAAGAKLAALFGAGRFGRVLAALATACAPVRLLTTFYAPYHVQNDWTDLQIGVCTGPMASWPALWPHFKHYD